MENFGSARRSGKCRLLEKVGRENIKQVLGGKSRQMWCDGKEIYLEKVKVTGRAKKKQ